MLLLLLLLRRVNVLKLRHVETETVTLAAFVSSEGLDNVVC